jgi:hypothetical protein
MPHVIPLLIALAISDPISEIEFHAADKPFFAYLKAFPPVAFQNLEPVFLTSDIKSYSIRFY